MKQNVVAPTVGESITEVSLLKWNKNNGEAVQMGDLLVEIESDKATVEVVAESAGVLEIMKNEGETVPIGEIIATIDPDGAATAASAPAPQPQATTPTPAPAAPTPAAGLSPVATPQPSGSAPPSGPAAEKLMRESGVSAEQVSPTGKGGRVTKGDLLRSLGGHPGSSAPAATSTAPPVQTTPPPQAAPSTPAPTPTKSATPSSVADSHPGDRRVPMSRIRKRIAERLVQVQHEAAILTTFNEIDMKPLMDLRAQHKDAYKAKMGLPLSMMSFFTKAVVDTLKEAPDVNASIDGSDIVYHDYFDIGIAVGTDRGLVVPVLRSAGEKAVPDIDKGIVELATKARDGKLSIAEMSGGTFTITNGGTYGSLMSTPILNPPQSGILGMHNIVQRPMAVEGQVMIRPMMYVALSYDHRIIDGKEAVTFLIGIKNRIEDPQSLGLEFLNGL